MKLIKYLFWAIWRSWFYTLVFILTVTLAPVLLVLMLRAPWYGALYFVGRHFWATPILYGMGFLPRIKKHQRLETSKSYVLIANHTSMMDIMLMFYISKTPFVFVGKKELGDLPIFGYFYKRVAILVDRNSPESRKAVYASAKERMDRGLSICIFPEGGVPDEKVVLAPFKDGAFRLAIDYQIPLVPMIFYDCKKRFPFRFFSGKMGIMRAEVFPFISTEGYTQEQRSELKEKTYRFMLEKLTR
ncbi:lysophospholipid acyltransferase family protein [Capnocytophaga catalasegens]|uniref:1-acyl-sn-glycerol-3-phosphate acyltransferase n=1 Tax=Capnocytophaga catalasegens TaxID=1004260 RepID=A0AAV5AQR7_9FLAO|nr:lysophospholipid acyltransferase family protein [Capnocytophaga catalasegens]GIZ15164.1 1-acyl-sn-glycerol-3-phosphate acyltransferase [Capnocytophaga catalasegens]GJM49679.1 1-acyl-sn-glycerol-3-phosphate acyltransferase [Capnocytophaga catalasegens]GJM52744.1 1-acyl-sn-glycerol-3-phosphate acyltransferase [Capnocytophaga catalasegens]